MFLFLKNSCFSPATRSCSLSPSGWLVIGNDWEENFWSGQIDSFLITCTRDLHQTKCLHVFLFIPFLVVSDVESGPLYSTQSLDRQSSRDSSRKGWVPMFFYLIESMEVQVFHCWNVVLFVVSRSSCLTRWQPISVGPVPGSTLILLLYLTWGNKYQKSVSLLRELADYCWRKQAAVNSSYREQWGNNAVKLVWFIAFS